MAVISVPILLVIGWAFSAAMLLLGTVRHSRPLSGWGLVVAGLMTLVSPLAFYWEGTVQTGTVAMSPTDLLVLGLLAFLGGGIAIVGMTYASGRFATRSSQSGP